MADDERQRVAHKSELRTAEEIRDWTQMKAKGKKFAAYAVNQLACLFGIRKRVIMPL